MKKNLLKIIIIGGIASLLLFVGVKLLLATATSATNPGTVTTASNGSSHDWTNPNNIVASDNSYATDESAGVTYYLKATNFGFAIPTGSTIDGIVATIERKASSAGSSIYAKDQKVFIIKADGTLGTTNKADTATKWPTTEASVSYGASNNLWDLSWTVEDINDVDFGVALTITNAVGGLCLAPETLISTIDGYKRVEDITIDDVVVTYNEDTKTTENGSVVNVSSYPITDAGNLYYSISYNNKTIKATATHRFFANGGWVEAKDLKVGDLLLDKDLVEQPISDIHTEQNTTDRVWDLTIENNHNFFANEILVHNTAYVDNITITVYYTEVSGATGNMMMMF